MRNKNKAPRKIPGIESAGYLVHAYAVKNLIFFPLFSLSYPKPTFFFSIAKGINLTESTRILDLTSRVLVIKNYILNPYI